MLGPPGTMFLNKIPSIPCFSGTEQEKDTVRFEQWLHAILDTRKNFNVQLVRTAINKSCVGDVADAICCLSPWSTLDDTTEKFKWLYRSACNLLIPWCKSFTESYRAKVKEYKLLSYI